MLLDKFDKLNLDMQTTKDLLDLGFIRHPKWDYTETSVEHYKLERAGIVFRAYIEENNGTLYCILGVVVPSKLERGIVDRWRDCTKHNSVKLVIENIIKNSVQ